MGWAFRSGAGDSWVFGAAENTGGVPYVPPGPPDTIQNWQATGSFADVLYAFGSGGHYDRGGNYYTRDRCRDIANPNPTLAFNQAGTAAWSGYSLFVDNCLTKAIQILRAYGFADLPAAVGASASPNVYFSNLPNFSGIQILKTTLTVNVLLDDPANNTPINTNPIHKSRPLHVQIFNTINQLVFDTTVTAQTKVGTDRYTAVVQLPDSWPGGVFAPAFMVKVQLDYTLLRYTPGFALVQHGINNSVQDTRLTVGDVNRDNRVNLSDYNLLMQCYSDISPPKGPCDAGQKRAADLNDDGFVNQFDYNLYLRVVQNVGGS